MSRSNSGIVETYFIPVISPSAVKLLKHFRRILNFIFENLILNYFLLDFGK